MPTECSAFDNGALVFKIRDSAPLSFSSFADFTTPSVRPVLLGLADYLARNLAGGASIQRLYGPGATTKTNGASRSFLIDSLDAMRPGSIDYLQLAAPEHAPQIRALLESDEQMIEYVHAPVRFQSLPSISASSLSTDTGWEFGLCGFDRIWATLDDGLPFDEIAVIDSGDAGLQHPAIRDRVTVVPPASGKPSFATHAGSVVAHITAHRDPISGETNPPVNGCCSAAVRVYNVWNANGPALDFNYAAFHAALGDVIAKRPPVLNLSISAPCIDPTTEQKIKECIANDVVVVAATGDDGADAPPRYPAKVDGVLAIGASTIRDEWSSMSCVGDHVFMVAPGEFIWTLAGDVGRFVTGTSLAAAMVTSAVWLARKKNQNLHVADIRALLEQSVNTAILARADKRKVGAGRLDVGRMAELLGTGASEIRAPFSVAGAHRISV